MQHNERAALAPNSAHCGQEIPCTTGSVPDDRLHWAPNVESAPLAGGRFQVILLQVILDDTRSSSAALSAGTIPGQEVQLLSHIIRRRRTPRNRTTLATRTRAIPVKGTMQDNRVRLGPLVRLPVTDGFANRRFATTLITARLFRLRTRGISRGILRTRFVSIRRFGVHVTHLLEELGLRVINSPRTEIRGLTAPSNRGHRSQETARRRQYAVGRDMAIRPFPNLPFHPAGYLAQGAWTADHHRLIILTPGNLCAEMLRNQPQ